MKTKKKIDLGVTKQSLFCCLMELKDSNILDSEEEEEIFARISESNFKD